MNMEIGPGIRQPVNSDTRVLVTVQIASDTDAIADTLQDKLDQGDWAHFFVFCPNKTRLAQISAALQTLFAETSVTGCTTAGQIGRAGYAPEEDSLIIALPAAHFATHTVAIEDLDGFDPQALIDALVLARTSLSDAHPDKPNGFGFLLIDGLSLREDAITAAIAPAMASWPIFGGSAGDGTRFEETWLAHGCEIGTSRALLTFVSTRCEARVFSLNHLEPTDKRMVVTKADPARRVVKEINAAPAAREYARFVDKDPEQLDEFTFSAHPVVVRLGESHHVRAIQRVNEDEELVFFAAIDEGMVLNVAEPHHIAQHLDDELAKLKAGRNAVDILACDCVLRRIEAEQIQATRSLSDVLQKNRVVGFSTYGEQIGPLHVNQTMTGVMLVHPGD